MTFQCMFFICLQGVNLWQRMVEFWGMFFICLWGVNLQQRVGEFEACFSCVCRMWIYGKEWFHMFTGHKFLMMSRCFKVYFSYIYRGMFFICLWGVWISDKEKGRWFLKLKKKCDICDICDTCDIFCQKYPFHVLNGWKTEFHSICLEFDEINLKNVTFIWLNLHAQSLIMSYYGLKWK